MKFRQPLLFILCAAAGIAIGWAWAVPEGPREQARPAQGGTQAGRVKRASGLSLYWQTDYIAKENQHDYRALRPLQLRAALLHPDDAILFASDRLANRVTLSATVAALGRGDAALQRRLIKTASKDHLLLGVPFHQNLNSRGDRGQALQKGSMESIARCRNWARKVQLGGTDVAEAQKALDSKDSPVPQLCVYGTKTAWPWDINKADLSEEGAEWLGYGTSHDILPMVWKNQPDRKFSRRATELFAKGELDLLSKIEGVTGYEYAGVAPVVHLQILQQPKSAIAFAAACQNAGFQKDMTRDLGFFIGGSYPELIDDLRSVFDTPEVRLGLVHGIALRDAPEALRLYGEFQLNDAMVEDVLLANLAHSDPRAAVALLEKVIKSAPDPAQLEGRFVPVQFTMVESCLKMGHLENLSFIKKLPPELKLHALGDVVELASVHHQPSIFMEYGNLLAAEHRPRGLEAFVRAVAINPDYEAVVIKMNVLSPDELKSLRDSKTTAVGRVVRF